jgi:hypothetical protein
MEISVDERITRIPGGRDCDGAAKGLQDRPSLRASGTKHVPGLDALVVGADADTVEVGGAIQLPKRPPNSISIRVGVERCRSKGRIEVDGRYELWVFIEDGIGYRPLQSKSHTLREVVGRAKVEIGSISTASGPFEQSKILSVVGHERTGGAAVFQISGTGIVGLIESD